VLGERQLSEYILYGVYVADVAHGAEHEATPDDLVHAGWFYDLSSPTGVDAFVGGVSGGAVGVAIQSTERFTLSERRALVERISARLRPDPST
jgi:hypothetical protein